MTLLQRPLALHDVRDCEALCTHVIQRSRLNLSHHDSEDLLAYLISEAWLLSERYEPGGITFSTWATTTLRVRAYDWLRSRRGRTRWQFHDRVYARPQPVLVSFDELDRMGDIDAGSSGDSEAIGFASLGGLVGAGSSETDRDLHLIRQLVSRAAR
jgi:DNA-directed RNA polymerase specialized sigma24 family protein